MTTHSKIPPEHLSPTRIKRETLFCFRISRHVAIAVQYARECPLICRFRRNHNDDSDPVNSVEKDTTITYIHGDHLPKGIN